MYNFSIVIITRFVVNVYRSTYHLLFILAAGIYMNCSIIISFVYFVKINSTTLPTQGGDCDPHGTPSAPLDGPPVPV